MRKTRGISWTNINGKKYTPLAYYKKISSARMKGKSLKKKGKIKGYRVTKWEDAFKEKKGYTRAGVKIGRYVFVGAGSRILPGVTIGDGALIGTGALVNKDVPPFAILQGAPGKIVGDTRDLDKKYLEDPELKEWYEEWQKIDLK